MVEVGTEVCKTPADVRAELVRLRREIMGLAGSNGLKIAAAGTHPFSSWQKQEITPFERYLGVKQDMQDLAQELAHLRHARPRRHRGPRVPDRRHERRALLPAAPPLPVVVVAVLGRPQYGAQIVPQHHLPPLPALGRAAGLRLVGRVHLPRGLAGAHQLHPRRHEIWWDVRPNWKYPTLEFRVCDVCTRVDEAVCIAALFQALIAKLWKLRRDNLTFRVYPTGPDRREQVAGGALRPGRQAARPGQAGGGAGPRPDRTNSSSGSSATWSMSWAAARRSNTPSASSKAAPAPTASWRRSSAPATSRTWWINSSGRRRRGSFSARGASRCVRS